MDSPGAPVTDARFEGIAPWLAESATRGWLGNEESDGDGRFDFTYYFARRPEPFAVHVTRLPGPEAGPGTGYARLEVVPGYTGLDDLVVLLHETPWDVINGWKIEGDPHSNELEERQSVEQPSTQPTTTKVIGSVALGPEDDGSDLYLTARDETGRAFDFGVRALGHPSRYVALDERGSFRFVAPIGSYTLEIGTREGLRTGIPRREIAVTIDADGMTPARL